jgi:hypothetical protein
MEDRQCLMTAIGMGKEDDTEVVIENLGNQGIREMNCILRNHFEDTTH